jgi:hypothetical protein
MASHSTDNPHLLSTPEVGNSPQPEEEPFHPEIPYALPHEEVNQFRRITRAYARQIDALSLAPILPRRKQQSRPVVSTSEEVFVHSVEDLIDFTITEIQEPLDLIPETPADNISEPNDFSEEEELNSDSEDMEGNNDHGEEREIPLQDNQPWLVGDVVVIPGRVHNLPRHPEKMLPKYDPETSGLPEDHIKKFILAIRLMNVQHEDVVCRLFPYTFENSASTWYFNFPVGSITSWTKFQKDFLDKFAEETTTGALMAELFIATMTPKERVKYFNQIFTTILNKFQPAAKPTQELQIEVYANALPASISMFVKRAAKKTLAENFEEAKTIEFQMKGCKEGQASLAKRETQPPPRRGLLLTRPSGKPTEQTPDKGNGDIEDLQRMVKKLSNEIIDMKRSAGEGNLGQRPYKPFFKRNPRSKQLNLPQPT